MSVISIVTKPEGSSTVARPAGRGPVPDSSWPAMNPTGTILNFLAAFEQPAARPVAGRLVLELDLAEPGERVADVSRIVDRQPAPTARIDVCERPIGKCRTFLRIEANHGWTVSAGTPVGRATRARARSCRGS